eukprot:TRINITY_DN7994_c0_g1_i16.p4 TRINITY_DN7994_c0_g1~~TRINITY_DN7994_c0_g1_i16.p4  ORF type:complete len:148 (-),score=7.69 TRINITY_DN7994_c0_g1_i16:648-1091(-)
MNQFNGPKSFKELERTLKKERILKLRLYCIMIVHFHLGTTTTVRVDQDGNNYKEVLYACAMQMFVFLAVSTIAKVHVLNEQSKRYLQVVTLLLDSYPLPFIIGENGIKRGQDDKISHQTWIYCKLHGYKLQLQHLDEIYEKERRGGQ